jgi:hypothetical protein
VLQGESRRSGYIPIDEKGIQYANFCLAHPPAKIYGFASYGNSRAIFPPRNDRDWWSVKLSFGAFEEPPHHIRKLICTRAALGCGDKTLHPGIAKARQHTWRIAFIQQRHQFIQNQDGRGFDGTQCRQNKIEPC